MYASGCTLKGTYLTSRWRDQQIAPGSMSLCPCTLAKRFGCQPKVNIVKFLQGGACAHAPYFSTWFNTRSVYIWKREEDASVFGMHYKNSTPDFSSVGRIGLFSISNYLISLVVIDANITPSARIICYASVNYYKYINDFRM